MLWAYQTVRIGDVSAITQWPKKGGPDAENALPMRNYCEMAGSETCEWNMALGGLRRRNWLIPSSRKRRIRKLSLMCATGNIVALTGSLAAVATVSGGVAILCRRIVFAKSGYCQAEITVFGISPDFRA